MESRRSFRFAYYVSGHGFGHATRVIACTLSLLEAGHTVHIVSNAAERIFTGAIEKGAKYRQADIDAGVSQPKAYDIDRQQTLDGLVNFLAHREEKLATEVEWLKTNHIQAVLLDAPFLPCVYSYLDAPAVSSSEGADDPLETSQLAALVQQVIADYSHASLLLRLPGAIPFPSIQQNTPLPSSQWVDREAGRFRPDIVKLLGRPQPNIIDTPLVSRKASDAAFQPGSKSRMLADIGVRLNSAELEKIRVLLVSFGGQTIPKPGSRQPSPSTSPYQSDLDLPGLTAALSFDGLPSPNQTNAISPTKKLANGRRPLAMSRTATSNHLYLPGAPPASTHQILSPTMASSPSSLQPPMSRLLIPNDGLLPPNWIALVCGLSSAQGADELPQGFYACSADVYVPDLCTICDAQLGKLGYGTCSETIAAQLPFIYVPRPLFVEEYGLKMLSESRNTLVEMDRESFEDGRWATFVEKAWRQHQARKIETKLEEDAGKFIVDKLERWLAV